MAVSNSFLLCHALHFELLLCYLLFAKCPTPELPQLHELLETIPLARRAG
jgi:hypothetical protein